jgi:DNA replication protein DnaC
MIYHCLIIMIIGAFIMGKYDKISQSRIEPEKVEIDHSVLKTCEIPNDLWGATVDKIKDSDIKSDVKVYLLNLWDAYDRGIGFVFTGPSKSGKSSAASAILKSARSYGFSCLFQSSNDLVTRVIQNNQYDDNITYESRSLDVDFLAIDHIEPSTNENRFNIINRIIRKRSSWKKPTILTSYIPENYLYQFFPPDFKNTISSRFRVCSFTDNNWADRLEEQKKQFFEED